MSSSTPATRRSTASTPRRCRSRTSRSARTFTLLLTMNGEGEARASSPTMTEKPRVTQVLSMAGLLPDYERWNPNGSAREKGTATDIGCQLLFKGYALDELDIDPRILPALTSLDLWLKKTGFTALRVQHEWSH